MKAIVTGASTGMGRCFAKEVAERGYDVIVVARSKDKLETLKTEIEGKYGVKVTVLVADLAVEENVDKVIKLANETDLLINNAGVGLTTHAWDANLDKVRNMTRLNIEALTVLTFAFAKAMKAKNQGRIINISSIGAYFNSFPLGTAYTAGKRYVRTFTRGVRDDFEFAHSAVKIQCILPGAINTNFFNEDTGSAMGGKTTPADKFAKVVMRRTLDQNKKEVVYGKMSWVARIGTKLLPTKLVARLTEKQLSKTQS